MKLPGIFDLTKREQRAVILIMMVLVAATIVKHYRDREPQVAPITSPPTSPSASPTAGSVEDRAREPDD